MYSTPSQLLFTICFALEPLLVLFFRVQPAKKWRNYPRLKYLLVNLPPSERRALNSRPHEGTPMVSFNPDHKAGVLSLEVKPWPQGRNRLV